MKYALVRHGGVVRYFIDRPFTLNGVDRFRSLTPEQQAVMGFLPVIDNTRKVNSVVEKFSSMPPVAVIFPDRVEITRSIEALSLQEIAIRQTNKDDEDAGPAIADSLALYRSAILNDTMIMKLRDTSVTPIDVQNYINANVNNLADARNMLTRVAWVVGYIMRGGRIR